MGYGEAEKDEEEEGLVFYIVSVDSLLNEQSLFAPITSHTGKGCYSLEVSRQYLLNFIFCLQD